MTVTAYHVVLNYMLLSCSEDQPCGQDTSSDGSLDPSGSTPDKSSHDIPQDPPGDMLQKQTLARDTDRSGVWDEALDTPQTQQSLMIARKYWNPHYMGTRR